MIRAAKISTLLGILTLVTLAPAAASADDGALYGTLHVAEAETTGT